jgi:hypothetical protein
MASSLLLDRSLKSIAAYIDTDVCNQNVFILVCVADCNMHLLSNTSSVRRWKVLILWPMYNHNPLNKQASQPVRAFPTLDLQIPVSPWCYPRSASHYICPIWTRRSLCWCLLRYQYQITLPPLWSVHMTWHWPAGTNDVVGQPCKAQFTVSRSRFWYPLFQGQPPALWASCFTTIFRVLSRRWHFIPNTRVFCFYSYFYLMITASFTQSTH